MVLNQKMQREAELALVQTSGGVAWMLMALGQLYADLMHIVARMRQMLMAVIQKPFDTRLHHCENKCGKNKSITSLAYSFKNVTQIRNNSSI